ncbi:MAG: hypothetical protein CFE31_11155 [Rhizobiales bacterium PAR1]|nr:MAG: hypothetical protein CFE31_11155 [Rhizobiales bacterium PAR1]
MPNTLLKTTLQKFVLTTALIGLSGIAAAQAGTVAALVGDNTLEHIDSASWKVTKTVKIDGLPARIVGMDVRPSDGMLYVLAEDGTVATVDPMTGKTAIKSKLDTVVPKGNTVTVDFNPVADRMRVIGSEGSNLRANVDDGKVTVDGKLKFKDGDMHAGKSAMIIGGAYANAMKGAKETALYDIDAMGVLVKQAPPNDGVLTSIGMTGLDGKVVAFDIATGPDGDKGWVVQKGMAYSIDLASGKATQVGKIQGLTGDVRDIAILAN